MSLKTNAVPAFNATGLNMIRIVIASYFMAVSIGLIHGTQATILFEALTGPGVAHFLARCLSFTLSFLLICGLAVRASALTLGLVLFWSSFITMNPEASVTALDDFWRDLALVAALLLTYQPTGTRALGRAAILRRKLVPRHLTFAANVAPRRVATPADPAPEASTPRRDRPAGGTAISLRSLLE